MSVAPRQTRQRTAVRELLEDITDFRSAQQLHDLLRGRGYAIGLATVYRCLQTLAETGEVDVLIGREGEARYRRCSDVHHHHLVCRNCGKAEEVEADVVEHWAESIAAEHGYREVQHSLEIYGICPGCSA